MNRYFMNPISAMDTLLGEFIKPIPPLKTLEGIFGSYPVDVKETETEYIVIMNVPGLTKEDIDISLNDGNLVISVKKENKVENEEDGRFIIKERNMTSFSRSFKLPLTINKDEISAKMENGILNVTLPKTEKVVENNKITIQ